MKKTLAAIILLLFTVSCRENTHSKSQNDNTEVTSQSDADNDGAANVPDTTMGYDTSGHYDN